MGTTGGVGPRVLPQGGGRRHPPDARRGEGRELVGGEDDLSAEQGTEIVVRIHHVSRQDLTRLEHILLGRRKTFDEGIE